MPNYRFRCEYCGKEVDVTMTMKELDVLKANDFNRWYDRCELCNHPKVQQVPVPFSFRMT